MKSFLDNSQKYRLARLITVPECVYNAIENIVRLDETNREVAQAFLDQMEKGTQNSDSFWMMIDGISFDSTRDAEEYCRSFGAKEYPHAKLEIVQYERVSGWKIVPAIMWAGVREDEVSFDPPQAPNTPPAIVEPVEYGVYLRDSNGTESLVYVGTKDRVEKWADDRQFTLGGDPDGTNGWFYTSDGPLTYHVLPYPTVD